MKSTAERRYYRVWLNLFSVMAIAIVVLGCGQDKNADENLQSNTAITTPVATTVAPQSTPQASLDKVKFKQADGSEKFSLKFKADGAKLVDSVDNELARLTADENNKVKIKDADDQTLGYVVSHDGYWKIEDAAQAQTLYVLRLQEDGDLKLEDGDDTSIYRIKVRDYGYEIETPEKVSLYKVKVKGGKLSLRDANEDTVLSTKSAMTSSAMAAFGFDVLTLPQQVGLAYAVNLAGGQ